MYASKINIDNRKLLKTVGILLFLLIVSYGCKKDHVSNGKKGEDTPKSEVIEIISNHMDFQMPDSISSGWHTFKYDNRSNETHFFLVDKYPEGLSIENMKKEVGPVFQKGMDLIIEGKPEEGIAAFNKLPEWFFKVVFVGGSGLLSPKSSSLTTLKLEPGYYIIECYVKMPDGTFHSNMGMVKSLVVTNDVNDLNPPEPTNEIVISSKEGIVVKDTVKGGKQVFSVYFKDQMVHENFVGHDVNLVRIKEGADISNLETWINWADPKGLISPAPEGFTFLGGVNDMPEGSSAFFEVDLSPGTYVLISEVPNAGSKGLLKTFNVSN
jgi:hypothetical protein